MIGQIGGQRVAVTSIGGDPVAYPGRPGRRGGPVERRHTDRGQPQCHVRAGLGLRRQYANGFGPGQRRSLDEAVSVRNINAAGQVAVVGAGLASDGVIALGPGAQGRPCALATFPGQIARVVAGAAFANGALLEVDGTGRAITQAAGKIVAKALAAATAAGDIVPALLILQR